MQINTNGVSNSPVASKPSALPTQTAPQPPAGALQGSNAYMPSAEWLQLLAQVRQEPDVRNDRVAAARERLRQGYYATTVAALQAAEAHAGA
jgi:hypothetical protein